jgi:hypothetical protein
VRGDRGLDQWHQGRRRRRVAGHRHPAPAISARSRRAGSCHAGPSVAGGPDRRGRHKLAGP